MLRGNSATRIPDCDLYVVAVFKGFNLNGPRARYGLSGIHQNVHEYLIQLVREAFDFRQIAEFFLDTNLILELVPKESERTLDTLMDIHVLPLGFVEAGEILQAADDTHDAIGGDLIVAAHFLEIVEQSRQFFVFSGRTQHLSDFPYGAFEDVIVAVDRAHRSIDLV